MFIVSICQLEIPKFWCATNDTFKNLFSSSTKSKPIHILWVPHMKVVKLQIHFIFYKHLWQSIFIQWTITPRIEPSRSKTIYSKKLSSLGLKKWRSGTSVKCCHTWHHVKDLWTWTLQSHNHVKVFEVWI
jgi:hypothetical protein